MPKEGTEPPKEWKGDEYFYFLVYAVYNAKYINSVYYLKSIQLEKNALAGQKKSECNDCQELIKYYAGQGSKFSNKKNDTAEKKCESLDSSMKKYHLAWLRAIIGYTDEPGYENNPIVQEWAKEKNKIKEKKSSGCLVKFVLDKHLEVVYEPKSVDYDLKCYKQLLEYLRTKVSRDPTHWLNKNNDVICQQAITTHMSKSPLNRDEITAYVLIHDADLLKNRSSFQFSVPTAEEEQRLTDLIPQRKVDYHPNFMNKKVLYTPTYETAYLYVKDWNSRYREGFQSCIEVGPLLVRLMDVLKDYGKKFCEFPSQEHNEILGKISELKAKAIPSKERHELPDLEKVSSIVSLAENLAKLGEGITEGCLRELYSLFAEFNQALSRNLIVANMHNMIHRNCIDENGMIKENYMKMIPDDQKTEGHGNFPMKAVLDFLDDNFPEQQFLS